MLKNNIVYFERTNTIWYRLGDEKGLCLNDNGEMRAGEIYWNNTFHQSRVYLKDIPKEWEVLINDWLENNPHFPPFEEKDKS